jgi:hypothetical protein
MVTYTPSMSSQPGITVGRTTTGVLGGGDLAAAAQIVADEAKRMAAVWSRQIPRRISTSVNGNVATISCDAPPAYPNEIEGVRHPVFGGRGTKRPRAPWVRNQHRPFLGPAADAKADAAMRRYADKIDKLARAAGFE